MYSATTAASSFISGCLTRNQNAKFWMRLFRVSMGKSGRPTDTCECHLNTSPHLIRFITEQYDLESVKDVAQLQEAWRASGLFVPPSPDEVRCDRIYISRCLKYGHLDYIEKLLQKPEVIVEENIWMALANYSIHYHHNALAKRVLSEHSFTPDSLRQILETTISSRNTEMEAYLLAPPFSVPMFEEPCSAMVKGDRMDLFERTTILPRMDNRTRSSLRHTAIRHDNVRFYEACSPVTSSAVSSTRTCHPILIDDLILALWEHATKVVRYILTTYPGINVNAAFSVPDNHFSMSLHDFIRSATDPELIELVFTNLDRHARE